jgi:stage V sporulation protein R
MSFENLKLTKEEYVKMFETADWNIAVLEKTFDLLQEINKLPEFSLDIYPNQFEIVTYEQLIDAMSMVGLPISYGHWSFGKNFIASSNSYKKGHSNLSYEMILNTNPCISYNMEDNTTCLMVLVMAHAAYGHNNFFKENYLFKQFTKADAIVDYMKFARDYVKDCENKYGIEAVEEILDAAHALMHYGVDKYKKPSTLSVFAERDRRKKMAEIAEQNQNEIWNSLIPKDRKDLENFIFPTEPQDNLLYFFEKNSPNLKSWERELLRIVRKTAQYFYPQSQTKTSNEGWASFWHYEFINKLFELGYVGDGFMQQFLKHHTSVVFQPSFDKPYYSGLNPYALGFNIYNDIKRICQHPTEEDREWFPHLMGKNWREEIQFAMENFKDESFIMQYLSPKVIRDMKLFLIADDEDAYEYEVKKIHNERGYKEIRIALSNWYNRNRYVPEIQIKRVNIQSDRKLELLYTPYMDMSLDKKMCDKVMKYVHKLWGFDVEIFDTHGKLLAFVS